MAAVCCSSWPSSSETRPCRTRTRTYNMLDGHPDAAYGLGDIVDGRRSDLLACRLRRGHGPRPGAREQRGPLRHRRAHAGDAPPGHSLPQSSMLFGTRGCRAPAHRRRRHGRSPGGERASRWPSSASRTSSCARCTGCSPAGRRGANEFQTALRAAAEQIFTEAQQRPGLLGMGTTVTIAYVVGKTCTSRTPHSRLTSCATALHSSPAITPCRELVRNRSRPQAASQHPSAT